MKCLLKKDFELMKVNGKSYIFVAAIAFLYLFMSGSMMNFFVAYVTLIATLTVLTTITHDDFDHGMTFLMTLPVSRQIYAKEKYVFGMIMGVGGWLLASAFAAISVLIRTGSGIDMEFLVGISAYLVMVEMVLAFMIPIQLKFGSDSGRIALLGIWMAAFIIIIFGFRVLSWFGIDTTPLKNTLEGLNYPVLMGILIGLLAVGIVISVNISIRILEKKEF